MESPDKLCALNSALLTRLAHKEGIDLPPEAVRAMERWAAELVVRNARDNLSRLTRPDEIAVQHLVDSLISLRALPEAVGERRVDSVAEHGSETSSRDAEHADRPAFSLLDIGSGAGLPGVPLAIVRPNWQVTLVESGGKVADFLRHVAAVLDLDNVTVVQARVEALGRDPAHRGRYDAVTVRAVARLSTLVEYALPLLVEGGRLVALKGADARAEVEAAAPALEALGGRVVDVMPYNLPGLERTRHLVVVDKVRTTPDDFPRRVGVASRSPLERPSA